jgi:hypothetical protein
MRERLALGCLLALGAIIVAPGKVNGLPPPALSGSGAWNGTVSLSQYPCPVGTCIFSMTGNFEGAVTAMSASRTLTYTAAFAGRNNLSIGAGNYSVTCTLDGEFSAPFTVSGGELEQGGHVIGTAILAGNLVWGTTTAAGGISYSGVSLENSSGTVLATAQTIGVGAVAFGPAIAQPVTLGVPSCSNEVPVIAPVEATFTQPY